MKVNISFSNKHGNRNKSTCRNVKSLKIDINLYIYNNTIISLSLSLYILFNFIPFGILEPGGGELELSLCLNLENEIAFLIGCLELPCILCINIIMFVVSFTRGKFLPPSRNPPRSEDVNQFWSEQRLVTKIKMLQLMSAIPLLINLIVTNIKYNSSVYEVKLNQTFH